MELRDYLRGLRRHWIAILLMTLIGVGAGYGWTLLQTPVYVASRATLREITGFHFHGGHLALGERVPEPALDDLLAPAGDRAVVVMERLANPDNVGGVLRNAATFGAAAAFLSPGCADPLYRRAIRVSMSAAISSVVRPPRP